ncbi:MAG: hypothetical protein IJW75_05405, partial [Alphaproteobacteria bacterium]|nr:hypothetical protein [Alphaproteobacteria bacterium]
MLDIKFILENTETVEIGLQKKGYTKEDLDLNVLIALHKEINKLKTSSQSIAEEKNKLSNAIKSASPDERTSNLDRIKSLGDDFKALQEQLNVK